MTLELNFPAHTSERTAEGTAFITDPENRKRLEGNNKKLIRYWQQNNIWLDKYSALEWLQVDCLAQRVANIRQAGVVIEKRDKAEYEGNQAMYRLKCTCPVVAG